MHAKDMLRTGASVLPPPQPDAFSRVHLTFGYGQHMRPSGMVTMSPATYVSVENTGAPSFLPVVPLICWYFVAVKGPWLWSWDYG